MEKKKNRSSILKKLLLPTAVCLSLGSGVALGFVGGLVKDQPLMNHEEMLEQVNNISKSSDVYFGSGEKLGTINSELIRKVVSYNNIGENAKNAIIASEDSNFYSNSGVEPLAIVRASFSEVTKSGNTGGSTITQQLVKNQLLDNSRSYERKAKEILLALRVDNNFSKEEILETYLNVAPFGKNSLGQNISGIETAAQSIFGVHSKDLNIAQAAYLAGFVQSPYKYTPFDGSGNVKSDEELQVGFDRQKYVLEQMKDNGFITRDQYNEALQFNIKGAFIKEKATEYTDYPYIRDEVVTAAAEILAEQTAKKNNKEINGDVFDIKIANYLIDVTSKSEIDKIVFNYLGEIISSNEEIYGKGAKRSLPTQEVLNSYIAKIAASILEVKPLMIKRLEEENMLDLYKNIEIKVARVLANMEFEGIHVSKKALDKMSHEFDERIKTLEASIYTLAGSEFNIASPKQLGVVLFEDLGLPPIKKTKTGYSTAVEVLEQLQHSHEIIPLIMEYRTLTKLNSTYAKGLVKDITREGKIHTRYEQTLTQTGRLSSVNPNLQNIPTRIEEGKKIRKAFIPASNDRVILSIDYSQIELRVLAHIAQDKGMIDAFKHDVDIHTKTASDVNGVPLDEVTPTMRREAKAVNFGIVYGISDFGLSNNLGITRKRAKEFIEKYLETFKGVDKYMTDIVEFAKEHGYVETLYNRRRSLPEINAKNKIIANLNARIAMNTPIQGTAADIIKIAMISAYNYIEESKVDAKLLLQVHDELIFDVSKDILEEFTDKMVTIMEEAANLDVKLKAEASSGPSWYEAK